MFSCVEESFDCFVNGAFCGVLKADSTDSIVTCSRSSNPTRHHIRLVKRFEGRHVSAFQGFLIDRDAHIDTLPPRPERRIEFIGGSYTSGFGNMASGIDCESIRDSSDAYYAFGPVISRALGAEYHLVAVSGKGVVREWGWPFVTCSRPFGVYYDQALHNDQRAWRFESWIPHAVVISLGRNDFSTRPHPTRELFVRSYAALVRTVRARYPEAAVICLASTRQPVCASIKEAAASLRDAGDRRVYFVNYGHIPFNERGCGWHPNKRGHQRIVDSLTPILQKVLENR